MVRRRIAVGMVVALVLAALTTVFAYRAAYGTFAWWHGPERISWCGRVYFRENGTPLARSAIEQGQRDALAAQLPIPDPASHVAVLIKLPPLVEVARVPPLVGDPLLATVKGNGRDVPCAIVVYLEVGADTYRLYVISGGP